MRQLVVSEPARQELPRSSDRYEEAKHFLELVIALEPHQANLAQANWYAGAYMAAVVGIDDALQADFSAKKRKGWRRSSLGQEAFAKTDDPDPLKRDPLGFNRAFREFRHLRMHYGESIVVAQARVLQEDMVEANWDEQLAERVAPTRWFLRKLVRPVNSPDFKPALKETERKAFNDYCEGRTFAANASQHLFVLGGALEETAGKLADPRADT